MDRSREPEKHKICPPLTK